MTPTETAILTRCLEFTEALLESEPPEWKILDHRDWLEQMELGPRYAVSKWFGPTHERERMRYRRAIDQLEARGLVKTNRAWGVKLTHLQLTHDGITAAEQLREQIATN